MPSDPSAQQWQAITGASPDDQRARLLIVEKRDEGGLWNAYALFADQDAVAWLAEPVPSHKGVEPALAFDYWLAKDSDGHSYAVFGYWVDSRDAAEYLFALRRSELANGAEPFAVESIDFLPLKLLQPDDPTK